MPAATRNFVERSLGKLQESMEYSFASRRISEAGGWLQALDPRAKLVAALLLIAAVAACYRISAILAVLLATVLLAASSRVPVLAIGGRIWPGVFALAALIGLPAVFLGGGPVLARVPLVDWPVTAHGLRSFCLLAARMETTVTLSLILVATTPWAQVLKAMRSVGVPAVIVVIVGMTYRFIFVLLETAIDMLQARRSRLAGTLEARDRRRLAASSVGVLLGKSHQLSHEVHQAMQARGYRGEVHLLDSFRMSARDWAALAFSACVSVLLVRIGR